MLIASISLLNPVSLPGRQQAVRAAGFYQDAHQRTWSIQRAERPPAVWGQTELQQSADLLITQFKNIGQLFWSLLNRFRVFHFWTLACSPGLSSKYQNVLIKILASHHDQMFPSWWKHVSLIWRRCEDFFKRRPFCLWTSTIVKTTRASSRLHPNIKKVIQPLPTLKLRCSTASALPAAVWLSADRDSHHTRLLVCHLHCTQSPV